MLAWMEGESIRCTHIPYEVTHALLPRHPGRTCLFFLLFVAFVDVHHGIVVWEEIPSRGLVAILERIQTVQQALDD